MTRRWAQHTLAAGTAALSIGLVVSALAGPAQAQRTPGHERTAQKPARHADIALKGTGFGTRVTGNDVPSDSGKTAYQVIGCATRPGIARENHEVEADVPGLGKVSSVKTRVWTKKRGGKLSSFSRNTIAGVSLIDTPLGSLEIRGITSFAHAWHDKSGYHASATSKVGGIVLVPPIGEPQNIDLPTPGQPIEIPGLATITLGKTKEQANAKGAVAQANALIIDLPASGTRSRVGLARAQAVPGVKNGVFRGFSAGSELAALDGIVTSGRTPLLKMPCEGTDGELLSRTTSATDLGGQLLADGMLTEQRTHTFPRKSRGFERGTVAHLNLGGQLEIDGIVGQVNVIRTKGHKKVKRTINGSTVGTITAGGEEQEFPDTGVLEIPGVAKLERFVTEKIPYGLHVVALRITLLDGTGAVIDLGQAKFKITPK